VQSTSRREPVVHVPNPSRSAAGVEEGMSDSESTGLVGIVFWCLVLAAVLLWALKNVELRL
jgi:hypothetical protein